MKKTYLCLTQLAASLLLTLAGLTSVQAQNVGIGTTTPTQTLDVNGSLRIRGLNGSGVRLLNTGADGTVGVSNPLPAVTVLATPPNLGSAPVTNVQGVAVAGNYLYVSQQTSTNQIRAYDITVPTTLTAVGTPVTGGTGLDLLTVAGNYLYVCDISANTLRVYTTASPGTPATPSFVTAVSTAGGQPNGVAVVGSYLYVASYSASNIERFSLANPAAPVSQGTTTAGVGVAGLAALNGYLYAANYGNNTLQTFSIDLSTGAITSVNVQAVGSQPNSVATANGLLYLTNSGNNTLQTFSLANPAVPASQGTIPTGGRPYGFAVKGNYAYISNTTSNTVEVRQLTVSNALGFDSNGALTSLPSTTLGDNLGNHTATTNLNLNGSLLVGGSLGTPGTKGIFVSPTGVVGINSLTPLGQLEVQGGADNDGGNDPGGLALAYRGGGYRHFIRTRHNATVTGTGNDIDFFVNSATTAAGSTIGGTGNTQVLTLEANNGLPRVGIGTTAPAAALDVVGTSKLGTNGTAFAAVIRAAVTQTVGSISANSAATVTFTVSNVTTGGTAAVSPAADLPNGISISYARTTTGQVIAKFYNSTGAAITVGSTTYNITVVQ